MRPPILARRTELAAFALIVLTALLCGCRTAPAIPEASAAVEHPDETSAEPKEPAEAPSTGTFTEDTAERPTGEAAPRAIDTASEVSLALRGLFEADQGIRQKDWSNLTQQEIQEIVQSDRDRRARVREILERGGLSQPQDYYHAAMVLQHGSEPEDFLLAHILSSTSAVLGHEPGKWLSAAALDRYLQSLGQGQVFGTQYSKPSSDAEWTQEPMSDIVSDDVRSIFSVPGRDAAKRRLEEMNAR